MPDVPPIVIRALSESDAEIFRPLRLRALREEPESFSMSPEESGTVEKLENSDESFILGAFTPELVATVGFFRHKGRKSRHKGSVWGVYVAPEARGQGLARKLMVALIARASTIPDLEQLTISVATINEAAQRLYLSLGFKSYGIEPRALKIEGRYLDEQFLSLRLDHSVP